MPDERRETGIIDEFLGSFSNIGFLDTLKEVIKTLIEIGISLVKELAGFMAQMIKGIRGR